MGVVGDGSPGEEEEKGHIFLLREGVGVGEMLREVEGGEEERGGDGEGQSRWSD